MMTMGAHQAKRTRIIKREKSPTTEELASTMTCIA